jgi:hypothetical protein
MFHIHGDKTADKWAVVQINNDGDEAGADVAVYDSEAAARADAIRRKPAGRPYFYRDNDSWIEVH